MISLHYNGTLNYCKARGRTWKRNTDNLNRGNRNLRLGKWGTGARRKFISRVLYMVENSKCQRHWTFVLTYRNNPPCTKAHVKAFIEWMRRRGLEAFAYSVEVTKAGRIHYHWVVACPYIQAKEINDAWARIRGDHANNAVTGITTLRDKKRAAKYASKAGQAARYASKTARASELKQDALEGIRVWQTSHNLAGKEKVSNHDEYIIVEQYLNGNNWRVKKITDNIEVIQVRLDRENTQKLTDLICAMNARADKKAEKIRENTRIRDQMKEAWKRQGNLYRDFFGHT